MPFAPENPARLGALCTQWATPNDVCGPCQELDVAQLDNWLEVASLNLYLLTGSRWPGECTDEWFPGAAGGPCVPVRRPSWAAWPRTDPRRLRLPGYPVVGIDEVLIDGVVVDPARYRVEDRRTLVWVPDTAPGSARSWPRTEGWSVAYRWGTPPPPGGREASAVLGCELAKGCVGGECRLPQRVQSITRQGITMAILDPLSLFPDGLTGLAEVDTWVAAQRIGVARRPGMVWIPGQRAKGHRRTG